jgi:hypothetical protein
MSDDVANAIQDLEGGPVARELSQPLRDAVETIVKAISDKGFLDTTKRSEASQIAGRLDDVANRMERNGLSQPTTIWRMGKSKEEKAEWVDLMRKGAEHYLYAGGTDIIEAAGHLAFDNKGKIPEAVKHSLRLLAQAGGMDAQAADKAITQFEKGEKEIYDSGDGGIFSHKDANLLNRGRADVNAVYKLLGDAIDRGLRLDIATHVTGDSNAIAKLPARQLSQGSKTLGK